jgi:hypothetical protein
MLDWLSECLDDTDLNAQNPGMTAWSSTRSASSRAAANSDGSSSSRQTNVIEQARYIRNMRVLVDDDDDDDYDDDVYRARGFGLRSTFTRLVERGYLSEVVLILRRSMKYYCVLSDWWKRCYDISQIEL